MQTISSKEYATEIQNYIEDYLYTCLCNILFTLGKKYKVKGIDPEQHVHEDKYKEIQDRYEFETIYTASYEYLFREMAIAFIQDCGFDVRSDGKDF